MAIVAPEGTSRRRKSSSGRSRSSEALATLAGAQAPIPPPPVPQIDLPPLPNIPEPQPVAVPNPLEALSRALAGAPFLPSPTLLETLTGAAQQAAANILQSRLQAQEQALQRALGLGEMALNRARLTLDQAQLAQEAWYRQQQLQQEEARRRLEEQQLQVEQEDTRRQLALGAVLNAVNTSPSEEAARAQIETIFSVYPELRALVPQSQIEALLRARFGEPQGAQQAGSGGGGGGSFRSWLGGLMDRLQSQFRSSMPWTYSSLERLLSRYYGG